MRDLAGIQLIFEFLKRVKNIYYGWRKGYKNPPFRIIIIYIYISSRRI